MRQPRLLSVLFVSMLGPLPALAGDAQVRKGFWISFGAGYGSAQARCDQCLSGSREGSFSGTIRLGGTLGRQPLRDVPLALTTPSILVGHAVDADDDAQSGH